MPAANIIQLRQLLAEKFPGLRTRLDEPLNAAGRCWATGVSALDAALRGGLPRGALTEFVAVGASSGGGVLMHAMLERAAREKQLIAIVDGGDSLEVTSLSEPVLARLLWVRCAGAEQALKAADLLLRDNNLSLVVLDLAVNPAAQLRRIPATTWYRLQRLVEETATVCAVFTPHPMVSPAQSRITLRGRFSVEDLEADPGELLARLELEISDARQARQFAGEQSA